MKRGERCGHRALLLVRQEEHHLRPDRTGLWGSKTTENQIADKGRLPDRVRLIRSAVDGPLDCFHVSAVCEECRRRGRGPTSSPQGPAPSACESVPRSRIPGSYDNSFFHDLRHRCAVSAAALVPSRIPPSSAQGFRLRVLADTCYFGIC